jgi:PPOX class probable F420-dependent enzyme
MGRTKLSARIVRRLADLEYRLHNRLRPTEAFDASREPTIVDDLGVLRGTSTCLLVTYRRSGEPVPTPVLFGVADGRIYIRAEDRTAKLKRIAANPMVLVAPCNFRGTPLGPFVRGTARVVDPSEEAHAYAALRSNYRLMYRLYESMADRLPVVPTYLEIAVTG